VGIVCRATTKRFAPHFHVLYREVPFLAQASFSTGSRPHLLLNKKKAPLLAGLFSNLFNKLISYAMNQASDYILRT
jgi:hypothetical protein